MKIKKLLLFSLLTLFLLPPFHLAWPGEVHMQVWNTKAIDAQTINGTAEVCSAAFVTWRNLYLSAQWQATSAGGTANVRVYVQASLDEANFMAPDNAPDLSTSDTSEVWHLAAISIPLARQIKLCVKGNAGNPADTVTTLWLGRQ